MNTVFKKKSTENKIQKEKKIKIYQYSEFKIPKHKMPEIKS